MITIVELNGLEIKKNLNNDKFYVYDKDKEVLSDVLFKQAVDFIYNNSGSESKPNVEVRKDLEKRLPKDIEGVFLYDEDKSSIVHCLSRAEAEEIFKDEKYCIPKPGSVLFIGNGDKVEEKVIIGVDPEVYKILIIRIGET